MSDGWNDSAGKAIDIFTTFVNTTIVDVYNEITTVIDDVFGWGPFGSDLDELVYVREMSQDRGTSLTSQRTQCLVGSKLVMLEKAL